MNEPLSEDDVQKRRDDALRRALGTPPKPKATQIPKKDRPVSRATAKKHGRPASES
jgi:hypothetical protein